MVAGSSQRPRIRVAAIIVEAGEVLLVKHEKDGKAYWLLPGGGVDWGESLEVALAREVREETGLSIESEGLCLVNDAIDPSGNRHILQLCFSCTVASGVLAQSEDARVVSADYIALDKLGELDLRPPLAKEIVSAIESPLNQATYKGPVWADRSDTPSSCA